MALDPHLEQISNHLFSRCCKKNNIYLCDEDIEEHLMCSKNIKEDVHKIKCYLKENFNIRFTTWD